jgi:hypothetical protein
MLTCDSTGRITHSFLVLLIFDGTLISTQFFIFDQDLNLEALLSSLFNSHSRLLLQVEGGF